MCSWMLLGKYIFWILQHLSFFSESDFMHARSKLKNSKDAIGFSTLTPNPGRPSDVTIHPSSSSVSLLWGSSFDFQFNLNYFRANRHVVEICATLPLHTMGLLNSPMNTLPALSQTEIGSMFYHQTVYLACLIVNSMPVIWHRKFLWFDFQFSPFLPSFEFLQITQKFPHLIKTTFAPPIIRHVTTIRPIVFI